MMNGMSELPFEGLVTEMIIMVVVMLLLLMMMMMMMMMTGIELLMEVIWK